MKGLYYIFSDGINISLTQEFAFFISCSGGVERDWAGVPRKLYEPGTSKHRCACVKNFGPPSPGVVSAGTAASSSGKQQGPNANDVGDLTNPNLMEYDGCPRDSVSCQVPEN
jgi:hypothetical protein